VLDVDCDDRVCIADVEACDAVVDVVVGLVWEEGSIPPFCIGRCFTL
jgi:hypothetical protein